MAKIIGTSGAWKNIQARLVEIGLSAEHPDRLRPLLEEQKALLARKMAKARKQIASEMLPVNAEIAAEKKEIEKGPAEKLAELNEAIREEQLTVDLYRLDKSILAGVWNLFRLRRQEQKLRKLEKEKGELTSRVKRLLDWQDTSLNERRAEIESRAVEQYKEINNRVTILQSLLDAKDLLDALLELEVLEHLNGLPENARVFSGIHLETDQPVRFEGKSYWEARMDHLIITPAGLFAVQDFPKQAEKATGDPYEQIRRAAHLCYEQLKEDFPGITVRSILAYRGHAPEQQNSYVKTVPLAEVNRYITWFKDNSLSEIQMQRVAALFEEPQPATNH